MARINENMIEIVIDIFGRITIKPINIIGKDENGRQIDNNLNIAIVDFTTEKNIGYGIDGPTNSYGKYKSPIEEGVPKILYDFMKIKTFSEKVKNDILTREQSRSAGFNSTFFDYTKEITLIHTIRPDLLDDYEGRRLFNMDEAISYLEKSYTSSLSTFLQTTKKNLRVVPIVDNIQPNIYGEYSFFNNDIPNEITNISYLNIGAFFIGFYKELLLNEYNKKNLVKLQTCSIELCVSNQINVDIYNREIVQWRTFFWLLINAGNKAKISTYTPLITAKDIFCKIELKPYGILGYKNTPLIIEGRMVFNEKGVVQTIIESVIGMEPKSNMALVDPAGLSNIGSKSHDGASSASESIYMWLQRYGVSKKFPKDVLDSIKKECDSKQHRYTLSDGNKITIIHTVGPNFTKTEHTRTNNDLNYPINKLQPAYTNTFLQFIDSLPDLRKSGKPTLRLLPISGGVFLGKYVEDIPRITMQSLLKGLEGLSDEALILLKDTNIEMCIYDSYTIEYYSDQFVHVCTQSSTSSFAPKSESPKSESPKLVAPKSAAKLVAPKLSPASSKPPSSKPPSSKPPPSAPKSPTKKNNNKYIFISNNQANQYLTPFGLTKKNRNRTWNSLKNQYSYWLPPNKDPFKYIGNQFTRTNGRRFYNNFSNYFLTQPK